jgi:hypothetical protein
MTTDIPPREEHLYPQALAAMNAVLRRPLFNHRDIFLAGDLALGNRELSCFAWAQRLLERYGRAGQIQNIGNRRGWVSVANDSGSHELPAIFRGRGGAGIDLRGY